NGRRDLTERVETQIRTQHRRSLARVRRAKRQRLGNLPERCAERFQQYLGEGLLVVDPRIMSTVEQAEQGLWRALQDQLGLARITGAVVGTADDDSLDAGLSGLPQCFQAVDSPDLRVDLFLHLTREGDGVDVLEP